MNCSTTNRDGSRCRGTPRPSGYCFAHDPELQAKASEARRRGGENKSNAARAARHVPRDMRALGRRLLEALDEVHRGELDPRRATAMASLAGAYMKIHEVGEIEVRLGELEAAAGARKAGGWR